MTQIQVYVLPDDIPIHRDSHEDIKIQFFRLLLCTNKWNSYYNSLSIPCELEEFQKGSVKLPSKNVLCI